MPLIAEFYELLLPQVRGPLHDPWFALDGPWSLLMTFLLPPLRPQPNAQHLFAIYCRAREPETLKALFYHTNRPVDAAALAIREAYKAPTWAQRMRGLAIALQFYEHSAASSPQCAALARQTEEQLKLLDVQRQLERDTLGHKPPVGAPPSAFDSESVRDCL